MDEFELDAQGLAHKSVSFSFKEQAQKDNMWYFSGYAAVYGNVDLGGDRLHEGMFAKSLAAKNSVPIFWVHQGSHTIGLSVELREDEKGLWTRGEVNLDVQAGREAKSLVEQGAVSGLSIGFVPKSYQWNVEDDEMVLDITEGELFEYSLTAIPMNPKAQITARKQMMSKNLSLHSTLQDVEDFSAFLKSL